jgi:hypothetical protein
MATLAEMLRQGADKIVNLPTEAQRFMYNPQAFTQMFGRNQLPNETGFAEGAMVGDRKYGSEKGFKQGEPLALPIAVASMGAPFAAPAARALAPKAADMAESYLRKVGGIADVVPVGPNKIPSNEILFPNRTLASLNSAEKSALTKFDKDLQNKAVMRRETLRSAFDNTIPQGERVTPLVDKKILTPEDLLNKQIVGFGGDQLQAGVEFSNIRGVPLSQKVLAQGGDEYPFLEPNYKTNMGWASNEDAARGHLTNINEAYQAANGRDVLAVKTGMNPEGANFSHPIAQALVRQLDVLQPKKSDIALADKMIRNAANNKGVRGDFKNFAGLNSPDLEEQLLKGGEGFSAGNIRKALAETMASYELRKRGFPVYQDVLDATLIPNLRGHMTGEAGNFIYQPKYLDELVENPAYQHASYSHGIPRMEGGVIGGFEQTIPINVLARKTFDAKIAEGKTKAQALRSMQTSRWSENFDQESLDNAMKYLEQSKKSGN